MYVGTYYIIPSKTASKILIGVHAYLKVINANFKTIF